MKIFRLFTDIQFPDRWYLSNIENTAEADFFDTEKYSKYSNLEISVSKEGKELDFTLSLHGVPIVSERFMTLCEKSEGLKFIPININQKTKLSHNILLWW
jgi:hypothetical protein